MLDPQERAICLLPRNLYDMLFEFTRNGFVELIREDVTCQQRARFIDIIKEEFGWATLHPINAVLAPLDVEEHEGGRNSISEWKLKKDDTRGNFSKVLPGKKKNGAL